MNTKKILYGGIIGGIAFFFLGWLIYGIILTNYMMANGNQCAARPMDQFVWPALILSNLGWGFFVAVIFNWTNTLDWKDGALKGALLGLLTSFSIDLGYYSTTTMYSSLAPLFVDILAVVVMVAIGGALIAWAMGTVKK
jgi:hypothetical protein